MDSEELSRELSVLSYVSAVRREKLPFLCFECLKRYPDHYMVTEKVWLTAFPRYHQLRRDVRTYFTREELSLRDSPFRGIGVFACLSCLEGLLDRPLEPEDFPDLPINYPIHFGVQMAFRVQKRRQQTLPPRTPDGF